MQTDPYTIHTHSQSPSRPPARRARLSPALASSIGIVLTTVAAYMVWHFWPEQLPAPTADHVVVAKFVGTDQFARLPLEQKEEYIRPLMDNLFELMDAVRTGKITREEAQRGMNNAAAVVSGIHTREYFSRPSQAERDKYLDRVIDQQERARIVPFLMQPQGSANSPMPRAMDGAGMKARMENIDPLTRARMSEFMADVRKRREVRGLPMPTPPR